MATQFRVFFLKYSILSFLSLFVYLPVTIILFKIAKYFLILHSWPVWYLGLPILWISGIILYRIIFTKNSHLEGYKVISSNNSEENLSAEEITAKNKLDNAFAEIFTKIGIIFDITYYLYPTEAKKNFSKQKNVAVLHKSNGSGLLISIKALNEISNGELQGVLAHETGHLISARWHVILALFSTIFSLPINILTLFISVAIGVSHWWLFLPSLILLGFIQTYTIGLPSLIMEIACDKFALKLGYGFDLANYLESISPEQSLPDGIHLHPKTRIKILENYEA